MNIYVITKTDYCQIIKEFPSCHPESRLIGTKDRFDYKKIVEQKIRKYKVKIKIK